MRGRFEIKRLFYFPIGKYTLYAAGLWLMISRTGNWTGYDIHSITSTTRRHNARRPQTAWADTAPVGACGWDLSKVTLPL